MNGRTPYCGLFFLQWLKQTTLISSKPQTKEAQMTVFRHLSLLEFSFFIWTVSDVFLTFRFYTPHDEWPPPQPNDKRPSPDSPLTAPAVQRGQVTTIRWLWNGAWQKRSRRCIWAVRYVFFKNPFLSSLLTKIRFLLLPITTNSHHQLCDGDCHFRPITACLHQPPCSRYIEQLFWLLCFVVLFVGSCY